MSLILEALRKSEAERNGEAAPLLRTPTPLAVPAPRSPRRRGAVLGVTVVALAAFPALAWWALHRPPDSTCGVGAPTPCGAKARARPPAAAQIRAPAAATSTGADGAAPRVTSLQPTVNDAPPAIRATAPRLDAATQDSHLAPARPPSPAASIVTTTSPRAAAAPSTTARAKDRPLLASTARQAANLPSFAAAPPLPRISPALAATAVTKAVEAAPALPPITVLPPGERSALPPLKVTMHVFAIDPARSFLIVDGHRVGEGDRIGDGIALLHIRRDGAEIEVNGRHLLLPNP